MYKGLGYSVYISHFEEQKEQLTLLFRKGSWIFTSFHISEEFDETYAERTLSMCVYLRNIGYSIMGDVSKRTLNFFGDASLADFASRMGLSMLRIDYGFSTEEIASAGKGIPICINASTIDAAEVFIIRSRIKTLMALHNFYPRPETGLDKVFFDKKNDELRDAGVLVSSFIPGNGVLRGPLFSGLPTLEKHRDASPYAAFVDSMVTHRVEWVFVGDGLVSPYEAKRISSFLDTEIIDIPVSFTEQCTYLYDTVFTVRADSPAWLMRMQESREYATAGPEIEPCNCTARYKGSVTIDNRLYQRYSGEIQIMREYFPADEKVNVIGTIPQAYLLLLDNCANGTQLRFVKL